MAGAVKSKQMEQITRHMSDSFTYEGFSKPGMAKIVQGFIDNGMLTEVLVWDFERPVVNKDGTASIAFKGKPRGSEAPGELYFRTVAQFVLDADGQWRMKTFDIYTQPHGQLVRIPQMPLP
jgi:hypothetical protein